MTIRPDQNWKQTYSGRAFPMTGFSALDIDLCGDVAESLARICRFGGHVPGNPYSVAQHCVIGAGAIIDETRDADLAAHFLLHDAHEAYFGDMTAPVAKWLAEIEIDLFGSAERARTLIATAKARLDGAIWRAAGLPPPSPKMREEIALYDLRMLATEKRQLLAASPMSWGDEIEDAEPIPMRGRIKAWPVAKSVEMFRKCLSELCRNARRV